MFLVYTLKIILHILKRFCIFVLICFYFQDPTKAKAFYPFLSRVGKTDAVVEYVNWGSRIRLYIPKETCLITFLLAGISCPRPSRSTPGNPGNIIPGDEFGTEALEYTKNSILQREVEIEVYKNFHLKTFKCKIFLKKSVL